MEGAGCTPGHLLCREARGCRLIQPRDKPGWKVCPHRTHGTLRSRKLSDQLQVHSLWLQPVTTLLHVSATWATAAVCCGVTLSP